MSKEAFYERIDVFLSGAEGYHTYRIPSIIVTSKGTILAFCEGRKNAVHDSGDIDVVMKRSVNGGKTWSNLSVIWDDGKQNCCGNPCAVVDRETDIIWLLMTHNLGVDTEYQINNGLSKGTRTVWVTSSQDDGISWTEPKEITKTTKDPTWAWYATGPGVGIQLLHGSNVGRLIIPCDHITPAVNSIYRSHTIYSDDHGQNWQLGGFTEDGTNECQLIERSDGSLLLNMRRGYNNSNKTRAIATSTDGGLSWSPLSYDPVLICQRCQASLVRCTPSRSDSSIVLFTNPNHPEERINMTIRLSYDDGATWPISKVLDNGHSAYSCLTVLPDGKIGCLYECGNEMPYEKLSFLLFNLEWLFLVEITI